MQTKIAEICERMTRGPRDRQSQTSASVRPSAHPFHSIYLFIPFTFSFYLPFHSIYLFTPFTFSFHLPFHSIYLFVPFTFSFHLPFHSIYLFTPFTFSLHFPLHCISITNYLFAFAQRRSFTPFCC